MFARRKFRILFEMLGTERTADSVFFREPFAQVNEFATMRTERPVFGGEPITGFAAGRAFDLRQPAHAFQRRTSAPIAFKSAATLTAVARLTVPTSRIACTSSIIRSNCLAGNNFAFMTPSRFWASRV